MARPLELEAVRLANGKWRVNVIARLSPTGKRQQRRFDTKQSALAFIEELKARRDNIAAINRTLTPSQLLDAASAFDLLANHPDATLSEATRVYLEVSKTRGVSVTLEELFARFKAAKKHKSKSYLRDIKWTGDRLIPLHAKLVSDITRPELAGLLSPLPDSSRNSMLRVLKALFRYGHDLGYLKEIPVRRSDFAPTKRTEIDVLPAGKIRCLLEAALLRDPALIPLLVVEAFCGVRPAEAARVQWSDIDHLGKKLTIRAAVSKTGSARIIELAPCALAWLEACAQARDNAQINGPIAPWSQSLLRTRLRKVRYHAGYRGAGVQWTAGALRDAFCSYHLAHYASIDRLITEAGHTDLRTTKDHYLGLVSKAAAAKFWDLFPPAKEKVVRFKVERAPSS
jgi:integrase